MPHWLSHKLLRLLGVITVTAIVGFLLLPALVVTLAAFNGRAILSFRPKLGHGAGSSRRSSIKTFSSASATG